MSFRLLGSVSAWLLIALIASPFTAPFSACDLSVLIGNSAQTRSAMVGHDGRAASLEQATNQNSGGSILDEEQFKDTILSAADVTMHASVSTAPIVAASTRPSAPRLPLLSLRL